MGLFGKRKKVTVSPLTSDSAMMRYEVGNLQGINLLAHDGEFRV